MRVFGNDLPSGVTQQPFRRRGGNDPSAFDFAPAVALKGLGLDMNDNCGPICVGVVCQGGRGEPHQSVGAPRTEPLTSIGCVLGESGKRRDHDSSVGCGEPRSET